MNKTVREKLVAALIALGIFGLLAAQKYVETLTDDSAQKLNDSLENGELEEIKVAGPGTQHLIV